MDAAPASTVFDRVYAWSRFAARLARESPALAAQVAADPLARIDLAAWRQQAQSLAQDPQAAAAWLLERRAELMLRTIVRDVGLAAPYEELVADLSAFADLALETALRAQTQALGLSEASLGSFTIVAMGKLGGAELNASSDIDLVFLCDDEALETVEPLNALVRALVRTLEPPRQERFVFRVDLRLRPFGEAGPIVPSLSFLESYFVRQARMWERLAWLRARPVCGALTREAERLIEPFVYRRYLDFDALAGMRTLHQQLREEKQDQANLKLGRGGIRELEFGTQLRQLIRGGHQPALRARNTLAALEAFAATGRLPRALTEQLAADYRFLRRLEHMLQYRDDQQTQRLPEAPSELEALARAMGRPDAAALLEELSTVRERVRTWFDETLDGGYGLTAETRHLLLETRAQPLPSEPTALPPAFQRQRHATLASARVRGLSARAQERLGELATRAAALACGLEEGEAAYARTLDLLAAIGGRSSYLALMLERPQVLKRLVDLAASSDWAIRYVMRHPVLLDELIDPRLHGADPDYGVWRNALRERLSTCGADVERAMDAVRHFQHEETFRLLLADLAGALTVERLSDHLSALADTVVAVVLDHVLGTLGLPQPVEASGLAVIAYGRWGGKELGYAGDLDLVFLLDDARLDERDRYTRAVQRLASWLTTMTAAGRAYEIDTRLRPDGEAGVLVTTVSAFETYQREKAWTWEHQALTRARYAAGDTKVGERFEAIRRRVLATARDWGKLRAEILDMRRRVAEGHPNRERDRLFDLKHDPGGLVDIEFGVQALVLRYAHCHPELLDNLGNIALARITGRLGLVEPALAEGAANAYRALRARQHALKLRGAEMARVPVTELVPEREAARAWFDAATAP
ncbi:MAG: bifunctional [glutamate--ammonia ligase]-adenylyl-L-tyrosine phosphorylase/[glutamate--ammonia-ligase] adenylyltransferase [Casimicrobiaceae bacterium]|nr:bifunctional [glutamate--ammonia ligase]-adenylyl-L-tyrosine phosphorylase/[glutamate--ammonia-ligase] adenylyltransferase [Casimicrobiaceae bacterium]